MPDPENWLLPHLRRILPDATVVKPAKKPSNVAMTKGRPVQPNFGRVSNDPVVNAADFAHHTVSSLLASLRHDPVKTVLENAPVTGDISAFHNALDLLKDGHPLLGAATGALGLAGGAGITGDLVKSVVKHAIPKAGEKFALLTAENAGGHAADAETNRAANEWMQQRLELAGHKVTPVKGVYTDPTTGEKLHENSFLVRGIEPGEAEQLGRDFGQNGIVTHAGYHDLAGGQLYPAKGVTTDVGGAYSELPDGQKFSVDTHDYGMPVDFSKPEHLPVGTSAAIQFPGKKPYTGITHAFAGLDAQAEGLDPYKGEGVHGFVTSHGRFVDRNEAYRIAKESGATKSDPSTPGRSYGVKGNGVGGLNAEMLAPEGTAVPSIYDEPKKAPSIVPDSIPLRRFVPPDDGLPSPYDVFKPAEEQPFRRSQPSPVTPQPPQIPNLRFTTRVSDLPSTFADKPAAVKARVAKAWEDLQIPVPTERPTPHGLLDRSVIRPDEGPTQLPLPPRAKFGPKAASGHMKGVNSDENVALIEAQAKRGLEMGAARTFYPSVQAVLDGIGQHGGDPKLFNDATTAAAIRNSVPGEIVGGTAMHWGLKQGIITPQELHELAAKGGRMPFQGVMERLRKEFARQFPDANGLQLMDAHGGALQKRLAGADNGTSHKIPMYGSQKMGDTPGFVLDTHESRGSTFASKYHNYFSQQGGFESPEYGTMESIYRPIAHNLGLSDRTFQAARWGGGGHMTGLLTPPTSDYAQIFEDVLMQNARHRQLDPQGLLRDIAKGNTSLYFPRKK